MNEIKYLDFDLAIEREGQAYQAHVLSSPAGQAVAKFRLPFSDLELENFVLRIGRTRGSKRRIASPEVEAAKAFGGRLFTTVFDGQVAGCLRSSLDEAARQGAGLRIRLRLADAPELVDLPWEYFYNPAVNRFLALSVDTPLVRYLELPEATRPLTVTPPLRILVMLASPTDYDQLDVEQEWAKLQAALGELEQRSVVAVERLEEASLPALQRRLRRASYHIFHFIGHGGFDPRAQDGGLVLEDENQHSRWVSAQYLGTLLHDHDPLRLVVVNACEGARTSRTDPLAGVAQSLMQQGIPAVIAMQFEITDQAAISFTHEFYAALADGYPVDAAVTEARKAIFTQGNGLEWGTPVLYLRATDGYIFDVQHTAGNPDGVESTPGSVGDNSAPDGRPATEQRTEMQPTPPAAVSNPRSDELAGSSGAAKGRRTLAWIGLAGLALLLVTVLSGPLLRDLRGRATDQPSQTTISGAGEVNITPQSGAAPETHAVGSHAPAETGQTSSAHAGEEWLAVFTPREGEVVRVPADSLRMEAAVQLPLESGISVPFVQIASLETLDTGSSVPIRITLVDGRIVNGTVRNTRFDGTSEFGKFSLTVAQVQRIDFRWIARPTPTEVVQTNPSPEGGQRLAIVTPRAGAVVRAAAEALRFGDEAALGLKSGISVPFVKIKSLELLDEGSTIPVKIVLVDNRVINGMATNYSLTGTSEYGKFSLYLTQVERIDFQP